MSTNIYNFISANDYERECNNINENEKKIIYSDQFIEIEIKKIRNKIYTFINIYGQEEINDVLNNICKLV